MIERLLTKLNTSLPYDKALHVIGGALLAAILYPSLMYFHVRYALLGTAILVCLAGEIKEVYDKIHKDSHTPDWLDMLATTCGGLIVLIPLFLTR